MSQKSIKPLLYINQPEMKEPLGQMQSSFIFSAEEAIQKPQADERVQKETAREKTAVEEIPLSFEDPVPETAAVSSAGQEPQQGLKPVKSFPSMTMEEKLDYLISSPQFYYCAFKTANNEHVGKLKEMSHDRITVMTTKGTIQTIEKKELLGIRIIG